MNHLYVCPSCKLSFRTYSTYSLHIQYMHKDVLNSQTKEEPKGGRILSVRLDRVLDSQLDELARYMGIPHSSVVKVLIMRAYNELIVNRSEDK